MQIKEIRNVYTTLEEDSWHAVNLTNVDIFANKTIIQPKY